MRLLHGIHYKIPKIISSVHRAKVVLYSFGGMTMFQTVAYIDAGTGSYLLAALAGGAATFWFFLKTSFARLLRRNKETGIETENTEDTSDLVTEDETATER